MKLVAVALALVAIATAAPRGGLDVESVVPEEAELVRCPHPAPLGACETDWGARQIWGSMARCCGRARLVRLV